MSGIHGFLAVLGGVDVDLLARGSESVANLYVSALGFLGLGVQPPNPELGTMIADGRKFLSRSS